MVKSNIVSKLSSFVGNFWGATNEIDAVFYLKTPKGQSNMIAPRQLKMKLQLTEEETKQIEDALTNAVNRSITQLQSEDSSEEKNSGD